MNDNAYASPYDDLPSDTEPAFILRDEVRPTLSPATVAAIRSAEMLNATIAAPRQRDGWVSMALGILVLILAFAGMSSIILLLFVLSS